MKGSTEEVNLNFIFKKNPSGLGTEKENMVTIYYLLKNPRTSVFFSRWKREREVEEGEGGGGVGGMPDKSELLHK